MNIRWFARRSPHGNDERGRRQRRPLSPGAGIEGHARRHKDLDGHPRAGPQHRARPPLRPYPHQSRRAGRARGPGAGAGFPGCRCLFRRRGRGSQGAGDGHRQQQFDLRRRGRRRGRDQDRRLPDVGRRLRRDGGAGAFRDRAARARIGALPRRRGGAGGLASLRRSRPASTWRAPTRTR